MGDLDDEELEATKRINRGKIYYKNNPRKVLNDYIKGKEVMKESLVEAIKILLVAFDETHEAFIYAKDLYNNLVDKITSVIEEIKLRKIANEDIKKAIISLLQSLLEEKE